MGFGEWNNFLPLPGIEPRFSDFPARNIVAIIPTTRSRLKNLKIEFYFTVNSHISIRQTSLLMLYRGMLVLRNLRNT